MHRMRSTLARLRYEVELAESLSDGDRKNILGAINELLELSGAVTEPGGAGRRMHVAVVDDDLRLAALIGRSLERLGYTSRPMIELPPVMAEFDAILADWSVISGEGSSTAASAQHLVVMSGRALDLSTHPFKGCPILLKPFDESQLIAALRAVGAEG